MLAMGFKTQERAHHFIDGTALATAMLGVVKETGSWTVKTYRIVQERKEQGKTITGRTLTPEQIAERKEKAKQRRELGLGLRNKLRLRNDRLKKEEEAQHGEEKADSAG
jgi:hypothetical protein